MKAETDQEYMTRLQQMRVNRKVVANAPLRKAIHQLVQGKRPHIGKKESAKAERRAAAARAAEEAKHMCAKPCGKEECAAHGCETFRTFQRQQVEKAQLMISAGAKLDAAPIPTDNRMAA